MAKIYPSYRYHTSARDGKVVKDAVDEEKNFSPEAGWVETPADLPPVVADITRCATCGQKLPAKPKA